MARDKMPWWVWTKWKPSWTRNLQSQQTIAINSQSNISQVDNIHNVNTMQSAQNYWQQQCRQYDALHMKLNKCKHNQEWKKIFPQLQSEVVSLTNNSLLSSFKSYGEKWRQQNQLSYLSKLEVHSTEL